MLKYIREGWLHIAVEVRFLARVLPGKNKDVIGHRKFYTRGYVFSH
jgi:hypothetical protein